MIFEFDCEVCGTHVRRRRSPANTPKPPRFCSQRCNGAARKGTGRGPSETHTFRCETCGRACSVYRSPSAPAPRFCSVQCTGSAQAGAGNPAFSGGWHHDLAGYVRILMPDHPQADSRGYLYEHRFVMEKVLGRRLNAEEVVHHRNRIRDDNRVENLQLLPSHSAHMKLHREEDRRAC